ncbi:hypothetical protein V8J88_14550 [Massilia sp. W12]|uniref:Tse2 family ADP-ribosyltransferase toxin n=1 Tax=Massilia sp. W12 TaxID=3126507 RepID=UPI0030CB2D16
MSKTDVNLYRSIRKEDFPDGTIIESQPAPEILYPDFEDRELPNGKTRKADVSSSKDKEGVNWVHAGGGTSLFDRAEVFPKKYWICFELPEGTTIPESLIVRFTN